MHLCLYDTLSARIILALKEYCISINGMNLFVHPTAASVTSITEISLTEVEVNLTAPSIDECVIDYIVVYDGNNVPTRGSLLVTINDTLLCQRSIDFSAILELTGGKLTEPVENKTYTSMGISEYVMYTSEVAPVFQKWLGPRFNQSRN